MLAAIHIQLIVGTIFIILYSVTILGLVLVIITENRNPLKTIPWVIVLLLAPGIGLLFYFFFGQDNRGNTGQAVLKDMHNPNDIIFPSSILT